MVGSTYNATQEMIDKLQSVKDKSKLKFNQNLRNYYDEINYRKRGSTFQFEEDPFDNKTKGLSKIYQEVLLLVKF